MLKLLKIISMTIVILLVAIIATGYIFIKNFDFNNYKEQITELAASHLGRSLKINGDAHIALSLSPTIIINDIELGNSSWAKNPQMVNVKQFEITFSLIPLLHKQLIIDSIKLIEPQIHLEVADNGETNWNFNSSPKTSTPKQTTSQISNNIDTPAKFALIGLSAQKISIEKGLVSYITPDKTTSLVINNLQLSFPSIETQSQLHFDIVFNGDPIKGDASIGAIYNIQQNLPLRIKINAYGADAEINGYIDTPLLTPTYDFNLNLHNPAGNFNAPETTLIGKLTGDEQNFALDISNLNVAGNTITGTINANINSTIPYIKAQLKSPQFDLRVFNQKSPLALQLPQLISSAHASPLVPDLPIPYELLNMVNADADINIDTLIIDDAMQANDVNMTMQIKNGGLSVNPLQLGFGGGKIDISLFAAAGTQRLTLIANAKDLILQKLHKEFLINDSSDFGVKSGGKIDLYADLKAGGPTLQSIVNSLDGEVVIINENTVYQTGKLKFLTGNIISQVLDVLGLQKLQNDQIDTTCTVVRADFANGTVKFPNGIALQSKQINLSSDGSINLKNENIDFSIKPNILDTNIVQAISSFIKLKGTLQEPKITLDNTNTAKAIIGVATTGGAAYLGSQILSADSAPCYTALSGTSYQNRFSAPSGISGNSQEAYQDAKKQIKDSLKNLENSAKDVIGLFKNSLKTPKTKK